MTNSWQKRKKQLNGEKQLSKHNIENQRLCKRTQQKPCVITGVSDR